MKSFALLAAAGLLLVACNYKVPISPPITAPPLATPIHGAIDVFYPKEFRTYHCETGKGYIAETYVFDLGPQSVAMFDTVLAGLFDRVAHVDDAPNQAGTDRANPIISLRLIQFTGCEASWPIVGTTAIDIAYDATISARTGKEIARITARGHADRFDLPTEERGDESGYLGRLTAAAMRKAAANFVAEFQRHTEIRQAMNGEYSPEQ